MQTDASLGCYKDDVCNSKISKNGILHANPWSLPVSEKNFLYFFNKLPFCGHFSAFSFYFFILLEGKCLQLDSNFIDYNLRKKLG